MARYSSLRASDADREAVAQRLRDATVEGRLEPAELEERLETALRARTYGDLERLLVDLPATPVTFRRHRPASAGRSLVIATRVLVALVVASLVLAAIAVWAAWWIVWGLVWFGLCARRGCYAAPPRAHPARRRPRPI